MSAVIRLVVQCIQYRLPGILFCAVLVGRLEGFNVWRFIFRATLRSGLISQIGWTAVTAFFFFFFFFFFLILRRMGKNKA